MKLGKKRSSQIEAMLAKYAISSIEDAYSICEDKGIDVTSAINVAKKGVLEITKLAYTLGAAIAIKKGTVLASYVAMDIGESMQAFCMPNTEGANDRAGLGHGYQVSICIKNHCEKDANATDYSRELDFFGLNNSDLVDLTINISKKVEDIMKN